MKERLRKLFSVLCALMLLAGCLPALAAESTGNTAVAAVVWDDENNADGLRPTSLTAALTTGGKTYSMALSSDNGWTAVAAGVGDDAAWSLQAPKGYTLSQSLSGGTTVFTLRHQIEQVSVSVSQRWVDDNNARGLRPQSVKARLLADGQPCAAALPLNSGNSWTAAWTGLPKYRLGTETEIAYSVEAVDVPEFYSASVSGSRDGGFTVTDTLQTGTLKVQLSFSGAPAGSDMSSLAVVISGPDGRLPLTVPYSQFTSGSFTLTDALPGAYAAQEKNPGDLVEGYMLNAASSETVGFAQVSAGGTGAISLKNTYEPRKQEEDLEALETEPDLSKLSFRIEGPDRIMPLTVSYGQFKNGRYEIDGLAPGTYVVYETNAGTLVSSYELTSDSVTAVAITVQDNGTATAKLINRYQPITPAPSPTPTETPEPEEPTPTPEPEVVDIPVTKTWQDNNNADGNRPAAVTVRLYANGVQVESAALTQANGWKHTFTDMPKYDADEAEITYTISEDKVDWYETEIMGYHVTNVYKPEVTSVSVKKIWNDNNNKLGLRPKSIHVTLSNGKVVVLNDANGWSATVDNLPTKLNGKTAVYTWKEQQVLGYTQTGYEVNGSATTFTNSLWEPKTPPEDGKKPKGPGTPILIINDYGTPLGVEIIINHVGDCFD